MSEDEPRASHEAERLGPAPPVPAVAVEEAGPLRRLLSLAAMDIGPLRRHREYRLLFAGQGLSFFGSMVTFVAVPYQVFQLTGSSLAVGLLSLAALAPLLLTAFIGGAFADAVDRRRMLQLAELGLGVATAVLLFNSLLDEPKVWVLFVVTPVMAALDGFQRPSLDAMVPRLVARDELPAAVALDTFRGEVGMIAGPAVGGILIATIGLPATYGLDVATYGASVLALALMRAVPPPPDAVPPSLRSIVEGVKYAWSRKELLGSYGVDIVAMFFGMPMALFPAIATKFGGAEVLGLLYAAPSVGSLLATLTSGWVSRVHRHGLAIIWAAAAWGVAITAFGLAPNLGLALVFLGLAGAADMISGVFRGTLWNQTIPDRLRGRLAGIEQVSYSSGPLLGNLEAGIVAQFASVRASVVSGGILCVAGVALFAILLPAFRLYDSRAPQPDNPPVGAL
ncbi:MAG TPA: MFS transporter [Gaiellaceae bacterium]|nr:MFS transporter [Gaiellaceae bacterium]